MDICDMENYNMVLFHHMQLHDIKPYGNLAGSKDVRRIQNFKRKGYYCKAFVEWKRDDYKQSQVLNIETVEINSPGSQDSISFDVKQQSSSKRVPV
jgi:hypothetical protein